MTPDSDGGGAVSSPPLTRQRLLPSSSNPPGDSFHAPPLPSLPFDIVVEILYRLPVKSLLQLRCVCKSWNSLISDTKFAKKHLRRSLTGFTRHHLILTYINSRAERHLRDHLYKAYPLLSVFSSAVPAPATQPLDDQNGFHPIIDSCDGIIPLCTDNRSSIILWNPSTRKFKILPSLENPHLKDSFTIYGFGYDHFTDNYKVVAVFCYECNSVDLGYKTLVKVYTLGIHSWREIQEFPSCVPFDVSGRFVSGAINWLASDESIWFILSLDLRNECYQKLLPPPDNASVVETLDVLRDCLCILSGDDEVCNVWLMKEYGNQESWINYSVSRGNCSPVARDFMHFIFLRMMNCWWLSVQSYFFTIPETTL